jgi:copper chaperone CopZ
MKQRLILLLTMALIGTTQTVFAKTLEADVHGMTCAFCVDSLERKLSAMDSVSNVRISLKYKTVRLDTEGDSPSIEAIKQTILDAGFTPIKVRELANENSKK